MSATPVPRNKKESSSSITTTLKIPANAKNINHLYNAPLSEDVRITRHFLKKENDSYNDYYIQINSLQKEEDRLQASSSLEVEMECERVAKERAEKLETYRMYRECLRKRLAESAIKKKEAFKIVLENVESESMNAHAPYLRTVIFIIKK